MVVNLSYNSWEKLWEQKQSSPNYDHGDYLISLPNSLGRGFKRNIDLPRGILLTFHQYQFFDDVIVNDSFDHNCDESKEFLEFVFNLSSINRYWQGEYVKENQYYLINHCSQERFVCEELCCQKKLAIDIHISRQQFDLIFGDFIHSYLIDRALEEKYLNVSPFFQITTSMKFVLQQMLDCPFRENIKQVYLESKSMEMLVLALDQMHDSKNTHSIKLHSDDIDRIHEARRILLEEMENPPSLVKLAQRAGLNDRKLKEGFKQVFGTTVFGYLHEQRLQEAKRLLQETNLSIAEVAYAVGFANRGYFAAAFRKQFGENPKEYRKKSVL